MGKGVDIIRPRKTGSYFDRQSRGTSISLKSIIAIAWIGLRVFYEQLQYLAYK